MKVPEEIRKVERPSNTVVENSGHSGVFQYAVKERAKAKYVKGENPKPRNGKVIGHIINFKYVPVEAKPLSAEPECLSYGASRLVRSVSDDIYDDLMKVYMPNVVFQIMSIASIKVLKPRVASNRIGTEYNRTFISRFYPDAALSKNTVSTLYDNLGKDGAKRRAFYKLRMDRVCKDHRIAIDGTLKQDTSAVNDLSAYSHKAKVKGCKDISILYAYDIETREPICAEVFPGNSTDTASYSAFIRDNNIDKGIIVADKGFPPVKIKEELKERPNLHFLTPVKRNDKRVRKLNMTEYTGVVKGIDKVVACKKADTGGGRFLYAFKDVSTSKKEEATYLTNAKGKDEFDVEKYQEKLLTFGVMVLESDLDMSVEEAYLCYAERWKLEMVFRAYKNDECLDKTNVQGDFSVIGAEFTNFISTIITSRIIEKFEKCKLLDKSSYGDLMDDLSQVWRQCNAPDPPHSDDKYWEHKIGVEMEIMEALGLSIPATKPEKAKRGRPRKNPVEADKPKRPRGRPRKNPIPQETL